MTDTSGPAKRSLVLFTGDLRVHDHPALAAAARDGGEVVPAFVLDEALLAGSCGAPNRVTFLLDCLRDLDQSLRARGAGLLLRRGDVVEQAIRLAKRFDVQALYMSAAETPFAVERRRRLTVACEGNRIELRCLVGPSVLAPGVVTPAGGDHYRVFTPYWRAWSAQPLMPSTPTPRRIHAPDGLPVLRLPSVRALAGGRPSPGCIAGGETMARKRLDRWIAGGLSTYEQRHDSLAEESTSRLSADLHFGCLSPRTVFERAAGRPGAEVFLRQLCWRDFNGQVLAARPDMPSVDYRPRGDEWKREGARADAWRAGLTGYPIVDAGMRQLRSAGFMHNRARLIVGSFLTKVLYVDWRLGAAHFAGLLQDADVANNVGNWQWVAGTGNDTRPNRVLNPLRQAKRFDPASDYVRRHLPELEAIPGASVHEPWRLDPGLRRTLDYPPPIVELAGAATQLSRRRQAR